MLFPKTREMPLRGQIVVRHSHQGRLADNQKNRRRLQNAFHGGARRAKSLHWRPLRRRLLQSLQMESRRTEYRHARDGSQSKNVHAPALLLKFQRSDRRAATSAYSNQPANRGVRGRLLAMLAAQTNSFAEWGNSYQEYPAPH